MTGNMVSSITYFEASSFAARTLGEENMVHVPPSKPLQGPVWYEGFSTDFLSENPQSPYGPSQRDSVGDRKAQPVSRCLGERKWPQRYSRDDLLCVDGVARPSKSCS